MNRAHDSYWESYDGLQNAKHELLKSYLGAWFPILSSWQGRVLYIDCHAGRGRHKTGHEGSPILALNLLLEHSFRRRILQNTEVHFYFFEIDESNYQHLSNEIGNLGALPKNIFVHSFHADYEEHLRQTLQDLREQGQQIAPSFAFVDPYGFSLSMNFLNEFLSFPTTELLINFMYRFVDMAMTHEEQEENMDKLFGGTGWRKLSEIQDAVERANAAIKFFGSQLEAEYVSHMYMRANNGALKYALIHATNHTTGREKMKEAMWRVTPDGTFSASERHSPDQPVLLIPEPDLGQLEDSLWNSFAGKSVTMEVLYGWLLDQTYLPKHLHEVIRNYRNKRIISASNYDGRFAFSKNPTITFRKNPKAN